MYYTFILYFVFLSFELSTSDTEFNYSDWIEKESEKNNYLKLK